MSWLVVNQKIIVDSTPIVGYNGFTLTNKANIMAAQEFNKTFDQNMSVLRDISHKIETLSEAFYITGNDQMSSQLDSLFNQVITAEQQLTDAYRKDIFDQVNAQAAQVGKTLSALVEKTS